LTRFGHGSFSLCQTVSVKKTLRVVVKSGVKKKRYAFYFGAKKCQHCCYATCAIPIVIIVCVFFVNQLHAEIRFDRISHLSAVIPRLRTRERERGGERERAYIVQASAFFGGQIKTSI